MADRISTLPDETLCHILSFRPTQNAIATSLLSKRWKPLWRSVSTLFFHDRSYLRNNRSYDGFSKFIYRTILTRDPHQPITSFRLECESPNFNLSDSDVTTWVNCVLQRGIENLHIVLHASSYLVCLRSSIFSSKTLVVLKLIQLEVDEFTISDLCSLKTLHLDDVLFPGPQYVMKLLSGCPVLEDMRLKDLFDGFSSTPINNNLKSLSKLVRAEILNIDLRIPLDLKVICNVEFLRVGESQYPDEIPVFSNLTHLELELGIDLNWNFVRQMLKKCPKLQIFVLEVQISSAHVVWMSPYLVPECLSSQLRKCSITNYCGTESEQQFAKYIMQNSGVLQTMTICTAPSSKLEDKFEMIKELSSCPRSSTICELLFK